MALFMNPALLLVAMEHLDFRDRQGLKDRAPAKHLDLCPALCAHAAISLAVITA